MLSLNMVLLYLGWLAQAQGFPNLVTRGAQASFYGFDMARMLKFLLDELTSGNIGAEIPTYVRNDNSDAAYRVDSANTVTNEKRLTGVLESNREELEQNNWLIVWYIHGDINTSDGLTKSLSSVNLIGLSSNNIS